jgi:hypothetical protein
MSEINNGGPAFPEVLDEYDHNSERFRIKSDGGMSMRDYFAAKVLPAIYNDSTGGEGWRDAVANEAYQLADAMIKAREKGQP